MTSYWPAWLATSWAIVSRTSFSGSTLKSTLIPVFLVKLSAVSFCRSTICGVLTIRTRTVFELLPPPPAPQPATPTLDAPAATAVASPSLQLLIACPPRFPKGRRRTPEASEEDLHEAACLPPRGARHRQHGGPAFLSQVRRPSLLRAPFAAHLSARMLIRKGILP